MAENLDFDEIDKEVPEGKENLNLNNPPYPNNTTLKKPSSAYNIFLQSLRTDQEFTS